MENNMLEQEQPRGMMFGGSVLGTVAIGLVLAGMAIYHFRPHPAPPSVVIERPPNTPFVERPFTPPRQGAVQPLLRFQPPPPRRPAPPPKTKEVKSVWDGVWRTEKNPVPSFQLKLAGYSIVGNYAPPNWSGPYPIQEGMIVGDTVEFAVADQVLRAHFRMTMLEPDRATVESWITDEDWRSALAKANKTVRNRQQALQARLILNEAAKHIGKPVSQGIFVRGTSNVKR